MKVTIAEHEHLFKGSFVPAFARVRYSQEFTNSDGQTVDGGKSSPFLYQVPVTVSGIVVSIPPFEDIDSTTDARFDEPTADLYLVDAAGKKEEVIYSGLRIQPTATKWIDIYQANNCPVPANRFYTDSVFQTINNILGGLAPAIKATGLLFGLSRLSKTPDSLLDPVALGANEKGAPNGVAELDAQGLILPERLPSGIGGAEITGGGEFTIE